MCGIAGIMRFDDRPIDPGRLEAMLGCIRHRGPDGVGLSQHGRCGLAHARLSIIDLLSGDQPMHLPRTDKHGPLHLVFNGEVYNHRALRKLLERRGHAFHSDHSDTEVLLVGYRAWGAQLPKHLHGMFAFAIWDDQKRELFLCRDRIGKKPLYLTQDAHEVRFASLPPALVASAPEGSTPEIDPAVLLNFMRYGYAFDRPMLTGMEQVRPAHWLKIDAAGGRESNRYWRPPPISRHSTSLGAVDALREVLTESVAQRLEADVPLGCFLSGGIDSSLVAALAQSELERRGGGPLRTFCVRMPDAAYDERPHAEAVARHLGASFEVLETPVGDCLADLDMLMGLIGEPTADSSLLPTYWLCRTASQHVKAVLSGDGGDELFGGYDRYRAIRMLGRHRGWVRGLPMGVFEDGSMKSVGSRVARLIRAARAGAHPAQQYRSMMQLFSDDQIAELMPQWVEAFKRETHEADGGGVPDWPEESDRAHAAMRWDLTHYLPHAVLRKVDRASMAVPVEVRCPLLGTAVMDLAGHLPASVLMPGNRPKALLRQLAATLLPRETVRRRKMGFAAPMGQWMRGPMKEGLEARLFDGSLEEMGVDEAAVRRWFDGHQAERFDATHRLFALLQLSLWRRWLDGYTTGRGRPGEAGITHPPLTPAE